MRLSMLVSVAVLAAISTASAQTRMDRAFKASGENCSDVEWSQEIVREYPGIDRACQKVEKRDGRTYVKFQGTVKEVIDNGRQVRINFKGGDTITLAPPPNATLYMDGRETAISRLSRGTELNFYVPEDQLTAQFFADETGTKSVAVPIVSEQAAAREQSVVREQSQRTPPMEERQSVAAQELPATGSPLPLIALSGIVLLLTGAGVTLYRTLRR